jgi:hypothetical protein
MIGGRTGEWHWLWDAYVVGMCVAAAAGVVMLDHRFPGNVLMAVAALGAMSPVRTKSIGECWCFSRR